MEFFRKILDLIKRKINKDKPPMIEEKTHPDNEFAKYAKKLQAEKIDSPDLVFYESIDNKIKEEILKKIDELRIKDYEDINISGRLGDKRFITIKINDNNPDFYNLIIYTEDNNYFWVKFSKKDLVLSRYEEHFKTKSGIFEGFRADLENNEKIFETRYQNNNDEGCGILVVESAVDTGAMYSMRQIESEACEIIHYAQPIFPNKTSIDWLERYSAATDLPIIVFDDVKNNFPEDKRVIVKDFITAMREQDPSISFPYIIKIQANKFIKHDNKTETETQSKKKERSIEKRIIYVFGSQEAYKNGELPYMIYMEGIDGRKDYSGMFRKLYNDVYIDNRSYRVENGKYIYDLIRYEDIINLAGKMPTKLSDKVEDVLRGNSVIPKAVMEICNKALQGERENNEAQEK